MLAVGSLERSSSPTLRSAAPALPRTAQACSFKKELKKKSIPPEDYVELGAQTHVLLLVWSWKLCRLSSGIAAPASDTCPQCRTDGHALQPWSPGCDTMTWRRAAVR